MRIKHLFLCLLLVAGFGKTALADGVLVVRNDRDAVAELWIWPASISQFQRPVYFRPNSQSDLAYRDGENYFLVARDERLREYPIGWFNIGEVLAAHPGASLHLEKVFETVVKTVPYYVYRWDCRLGRYVRETRYREVPRTVEKFTWTWRAPAQ